MQSLVVTDDDNTYNATVRLLDDEPPEPDQGIDYTGGWKMVTNVVLHGDRDYNGTSRFSRDQIYLVKKAKFRKGDYTDYIILELDEDRELRNMDYDNVYLIWWQNLMPPEEFKAAKMKEAAKKKAQKENSK